MNDDPILTAPRIPIIAIGASAGGLDPYEKFFDDMAADTGAAFVIIQHLSPNFHSVMDELLSRHSTMKIERVVDGMRIKPNTIYLNPPRIEMVVQNGQFKLTEQDKANLINLPIDTFFVSLSKEMGKKAVAVVLSGTGSDGTRGAEAIKTAGGTVLAQDTDSAKFDGMPGSIIKLGLADAIGYPQMLAENVARLLKKLPLIKDPEYGVEKDPKQRIFRILLERFGTEFNYYKKATIERRLERRAGLRSLNMADYASVVANEPREAELLFGDLLIEVTSFFRDPDSFAALKERVIPELAANMSRNKPVRIWVPGCASGEEAYSIAILFADYAREHGLDLQLKILATDIHDRSLSAASTGIYSRVSLAGLAEYQRERYFDNDGDTFQIKPHLRRMVVFRPHNIMKDPPFTRIDLISCRNVLIYFNNVAQQKTLALFHFSLRTKGYLFLGPSETVGELETEFDTTDAKWRVFQKRRDVRLLESVSLLPSSSRPKKMFELPEALPADTGSRGAPVLGVARQAYSESLAEMLRRYAPPGFLLNEDGEIAHVFGDAGSFLQVASGTFSKKMIDLVDDDLKMIVATGLERLKGTKSPRFERRVNTENEELGRHSVIVAVDRIRNDNMPQPYFLLTMQREKPKELEAETIAPVNFDSAEMTNVMQSRISVLERDLRSTEESLQSTIEELETSNEELQATNEELMASNEELQSTNEELHSVNEELYTVSTEHQLKIVELTEATDDMKNLLKAIEIGILFLDDHLCVRHFTDPMQQTFNIIRKDAGRPIDHLTYRFERFDLIGAIRKVRETGEMFEREVEADRKTFIMRILPYQASFQDAGGAVITMVDITELKEVEFLRRETARNYEAIVRDLTDFLLRWSPEDGKISYANQRLSDELGIPLSEITGQNISKIGSREDGKPLFERLSNLKNDAVFENEILQYDSAGREVYVSGTVRPILDSDGKIGALQATGRNVTRQYRYLSALESLLQLQETTPNKNEFTLMQRFLALGCEYLELSRGVIATLEGDAFRVLSVYGEGELEVGDLISETDTIVGQITDDKSLYSYAEVSESKVGLKNIKGAKGAGSFLSSMVVTTHGNSGRLAFSDTQARSEPFTDEHKMFVRILARSFGRVLEQMTFKQDIEYRRQHYVNVYDQAPLMRCTTNEAGEVLEANAVWLDTMGYSEKSMIGADFEDFVESNTFSTDWPKFPTLKKSDDGKRTVQVKLISSTKQLVDVELTSTELIVPGTNETRYLLAMVDMTERNRAFERIELQNVELESANKGLSTFAYVASHDLQEPLRKIQQYVELLGVDCREKLTEDETFYLDVITGSAARISLLVKDILSYTTASNTDVEIVAVDLNELAHEVVEDLGAMIEEKKAKVRIGKLPTVLADEGALRLVFQNLVSNGMKYQPEGAKPTVSIRSKKLKSGDVIEIVDNGIGIDEVDGSDVFEPFVRLHSKFEYAGTGIGLAICKAVCDRLGWEISHSPNPKGGTIFSIKTINPRT